MDLLAGGALVIGGINCIKEIQIVHDRESEGYIDSFYDMEDLNIPTNNDGSTPYEFYFTTPKKDGDLYISILSYPSDLIPNECASSSVDVY